MEKKTTSPKLLKQRKFLLILPLLCLPFVTMIFWALGGGKLNEASAQENTKAGLNLELPEAMFTDGSALSKLNFYEKAERDSARFKDLVKTDPYYKVESFKTRYEGEPFSYKNQTEHPASNYQNGYIDPNEEKVYRKIEELNKQLNNPPVQPAANEKSKASEQPLTIKSDEVDRLENLMQTMKEGKNQEDPEMQQLDQMLEKILAIQHPEKVKQLIEETPTKDLKNFTVTTNASYRSNGFYSLEENPLDSISQNTIEAEIYGTQVLVSGSTVKLQLLQDVFISGKTISKGTFVYGTASLNNERLGIQINSIRFLSSIFPVNLEVYDLDGMSGLFIPGSITNDIARQSVNDLSQTAGMSSLAPSVIAQATTAGINAAKNILSSKTKHVKFTLNDGYKVLLVANH